MDKINWADFYAAHQEDPGTVLVQMTDQVICEKWTEVVDELDKFEAKILDLRLFGKDYEYHLMRSSVGGQLWMREKNDQKNPIKEADFFDEDHYLDIDTTKITENHIRTTGGGTYTLPMDFCKTHNLRDAYITIRNYVGYHETTGDAYIKDWRIVGLGGMNNGSK